MSFLLLSTLAVLAAVGTLACTLGIQSYFSRRRKERFQTLELVPNVLMTRYPLLFVGRTRSIFRMSGDFLELPVYLQEHGYQVEEIEIAEAGSNFESLSFMLATCERPVHMIVCESLSRTAYELALQGHAKLATLTLLGVSPDRARSLALRPTKRPVFERPELRPPMITRSFHTEEIALSHMVSLAEHDLR